MALFNSLTFDGVNSLDSGIYITGEAVYNAPQRQVEMVTIPGRNGTLAIDQGRFENIEVTYPAGCFADDQSDFADKVMEFRNELASRFGYKRLVDTYHPDEFRLGTYSAGLEVGAVGYHRAGEFDITFNCKPQRFLVSGEEAVTIGEWGETETATGDIVEIDNPDGTLGVKSLLVTLDPIQEGSGTPSPTNVRPISGRTECVTEVSGVNVWDEEWEVGTITSGNPSPSSVSLRSKNYIPIVSGNAYQVVYPNNASLGHYIHYYDENKEWLSVSSQNPFTPPQNACYVKFVVTYYIQQYATYNNDISINYPSTDTEYHAYDGDTYTTTLGQTVYGGTLDVVSGELVVDRAMVTLDGSSDETWVIRNEGQFYVRGTTDDAFVVTTSTQSSVVGVSSNKYYGTTWAGFQTRTNCISLFYGQPWVIIQDSRYTDVESLKEDLASNPLQVVYKLATPQTYTLTPQQIDLLPGQNNVWSDGRIAIEYGLLPNIIVNPTLFASNPLLVVTGSGTLSIGNQTLTIASGSADQVIYIDCDSQEAWEIVGGGKLSRNDYIQNAGEVFPVLNPGVNNIIFGTGITQLEITPRWWRV